MLLTAKSGRSPASFKIFNSGWARRDTLSLILSLGFFAASGWAASRWGGEYPFFWLAVFAIALGFFNLATARSAPPKDVALVWIGISMGLLAAETAFIGYEIFGPHERVVSTGSTPPTDYYVSHPELGYAAHGGVTARARRSTAKRVIYDATYTISSDGVRATKGNPRGDTWLFMGCSRTFGEGVNDHETLPSRFSAELGYTANVVNLGFHGYGAHQMLKILEDGTPRGAGSPVKQVVYQAIPHHVRRSAGRAKWDLEGPAYKLSGDSIVFAGRLHGRGEASLLRFALRSRLARFFLDRLYFNADPGDEEIELYGRIVDRAARLAEDRLGASFTVLYWDEETPAGRKILERLERGGISVIRSSGIIPREDWPVLKFPIDGHPTPDAYRRLAKGLAAHFGLAGTSQAKPSGVYSIGGLTDPRINPANRLYFMNVPESRIQPPGSLSARR